MSNSVWPHRRQPTRLLRPWDSPGKNTGVGCHFLLQCMKVKVKGKSLSHVWLVATPWTAAYQAPPSMGFSWQGYWSGVPLPSPFFSLNNMQFHSLYFLYWKHISCFPYRFFTVTFIIDKYVTERIRFYLISINLGTTVILTLNTDDSKNMSILIRPTT